MCTSVELNEIFSFSICRYCSEGFFVLFCVSKPVIFVICCHLLGKCFLFYPLGTDLR